MTPTATASTPLFPFTLRDEPEFHRFALCATAAAAIGGVLHAAVGGFYKGVPAWMFAGPLVLLLAPRLDVFGRLLMLGGVCAAAFGVMIFPFMPVMFGLAFGLLLFLARLRMPGRSGQVHLPQVTFALLGGVIVTVGAEWVLRRLWISAGRTPLGQSLMLDVVLCAVDGLLLSLVALPLHLHPHGDVLREEGERIRDGLNGRFEELGDKVLAHYDECRKLIAALPKDRALRELDGTFQELTRSAFEHLREWSGVDEELADAEAAPAHTELQRLRAQLAASKDPIAQQHLSSAISAVEEEQARLETLSLTRQRALARLEAQVALLSRVKGALLGIRSGHAEVRSAELTALARRLTAQSRSHSLEGDVMREVAAGAELDQLARR